MKKFLYLTVPLILAGCGDPISDPVTGTIVSAPNIQLDPISEQPLPPLKPVDKPAAQTGSTYLPETILLAQNNTMPHMYMQIPKLMGTETLQTIKADIKEPPVEISPCYNAVLTQNIPVVDKQYQYNGWWLLGTLNNSNANFYWATQISNTQVGAVPTGYVTNTIGEPPADVKLDLGYAQLPYQWVTRLGYYSGFPVNPDEKCPS
jgi:hypothetical protein